MLARTHLHPRGSRRRKQSGSPWTAAPLGAAAEAAPLSTGPASRSVKCVLPAGQEQPSAAHMCSRNAALCTSTFSPDVASPWPCICHPAASTCQRLNSLKRQACLRFICGSTLNTTAKQSSVLQSSRLFCLYTLDPKISVTRLSPCIPNTQGTWTVQHAELLSLLSWLACCSCLNADGAKPVTGMTCRPMQASWPRAAKLLTAASRALTSSWPRRKQMLPQSLSWQLKQGVQQQLTHQISRTHLAESLSLTRTQTCLIWSA